MLDIKFIREHADEVQEKAKQKGYDVDIQKLIRKDDERKAKLFEIEGVRSKRNALAEKWEDGKPNNEQVESGKKLRDEQSELEGQLEPIQIEVNNLLRQVPNMPADDVPIGTSEKDNVVSKEWGEKPKFDFEPKTHWELGETAGTIDKERAAKVAGARFVYIKGDLVRLQFAIIQFALDVLTDEKHLAKIRDLAGVKVSLKKFVPTLPPAVAKTKVYEATGRLNKQEQTYKLDGEDLWLNASAEHTLAPMFMGEVLDANDLPLRFVGYTTAFRREAGTYGKDTEGLIRLHQFDKLEMESFTLPEDGMNEHLFMVAVQEYLMQQLHLPYRVLNKCTADIGFPNARGVDLETWMPGLNKYLETHTADFISDFQAEGTKTRVKTDVGNVYVHNNDATVFAAGRTMAAIMENYQTKGGKVAIPKVLQPYMHGQTEL